MDCEKAQFEPSFDVLRNLINMKFQRNINEYTSLLVSRSPCEKVQKNLMKISTHMKSSIVSLTHLLMWPQPAHISMKLPKEMNIFSRILLHLDHALSTGKSTSSKEVNIISQLLINILKKKKINRGNKSASWNDKLDLEV